MSFSQRRITSPFSWRQFVFFRRARENPRRQRGLFSCRLSIWDGACLNWVGLPYRHRSGPDVSLVAPDIREAHLNRAPSDRGVVTGAPGDLRVNAAVRDEPSRTTASRFPSGATVLEAANALARKLRTELKPYTTNNPEAVKEFFAGRADAALALDPSWARRMSPASKRYCGPDGKMICRRSLRPPEPPSSGISNARGSMRSSRRPQRAVRSHARIGRVLRWSTWGSGASGDAALGDQESCRGHRGIQEAIELDPTNVVFWNTLAYAQTFAGDLEAAKRSIAEYRRLQPSEANPLDSLGEINFYEGVSPTRKNHFFGAFEKTTLF